MARLPLLINKRSNLTRKTERPMLTQMSNNKRKYEVFFSPPIKRKINSWTIGGAYDWCQETEILIGYFFRWMTVFKKKTYSNTLLSFYQSNWYQTSWVFHLNTQKLRNIQRRLHTNYISVPYFFRLIYHTCEFRFSFLGIFFRHVYFCMMEI